MCSSGVNISDSPENGFVWKCQEFCKTQWKNLKMRMKKLYLIDFVEFNFPNFEYSNKVILFCLRTRRSAIAEGKDRDLFLDQYIFSLNKGENLWLSISITNRRSQ